MLYCRLSEFISSFELKNRTRKLSCLPTARPLCLMLRATPGLANNVKLRQLSNFFLTPLCFVKVAPFPNIFWNAFTPNYVFCVYLKRNKLFGKREKEICIFIYFLTDLNTIYQTQEFSSFVGPLFWILKRDQKCINKPFFGQKSKKKIS